MNRRNFLRILSCIPVVAGIFPSFAKSKPAEKMPEIEHFYTPVDPVAASFDPRALFAYFGGTIYVNGQKYGCMYKDEPSKYGSYHQMEQQMFSLVDQRLRLVWKYVTGQPE